MAHVPCRVRKYRKSAHLSQRELAELIGLRSQGVISDIESGGRSTSLRAAIALALVFDVTLVELFPSLHARVAQDLSDGAGKLGAHLHTRKRRAATVQHLQALVDRLAEPA